jgi:5-methylcytosine-specific restriction endonuclease McrA
MRSALVLNATYEPLSVVPARRAACLILAERADLVADDGTEIHSTSLVIPSPSVVRLRYMVKAPFHRRTTLSRRALFARDDHRCQYCGGFADSIDHIVPRRWPPRVGERRRRVPSVQPAQTRPHTGGGQHGAGPAAADTEGTHLDHRRRQSRARRVAAVPRRGKLRA